MSLEDTAGLSVNNSYGARGTQEGLLSGGALPINGSVNEAVVYITGEDFGSGTDYLTKFTLPAGSTVREVIAEVTEVFALGGTTPTINVGTDSSEGTNFGIELSEAQAEALGTYDGTPAGTWAAPLAADTDISVALDGTTPTVTSAGEAKVVIRYSKI